MFFIISSIKLGRFWSNLVHYFLNKYAAKSCKRFIPHLNNGSTLSYENSDAHCARATVELFVKKTQEFIPPGQIWIHFITAYGEYCKRRCTKQRYSKNGSLFPNAVYIVVSIGANSSVKVFNTLDDISSGPDGWFEFILLSSCTTLGTVTVIPAMA